MVQVRLFARLRELAGTDAASVEVPTGATPAAAYAAVRTTHPDLPADPHVFRAAINREFATWDAVLNEGDELAVVPPVSGGSDAPVIELTTEPLDARRIEAAVAHSGAGGICTFTGVVRDNARGRAVTRLEYEAFAEMAEAEMARIAAEIVQRWPGARVAIAHRTGRLEIGEASVVVSVACPHRAEAFEACRFGIDTLKNSVPIWKKEYAADGEVWIEEGA